MARKRTSKYEEMRRETLPSGVTITLFAQRLPAAVGQLAIDVEKLARKANISDGIELWNKLLESRSVSEPMDAANAWELLVSIAQRHRGGVERLGPLVDNLARDRRGPQEWSKQRGRPKLLAAIHSWLAACKAAGEKTKIIRTEQLEKLKSFLREQDIRIPPDETLRREIRNVKQSRQ